jgi:hypothetical protein
MPIERDLVGMTIHRGVYDFEPNIMMPPMYTDLGKRHMRRREMPQSRCVVVWIDQMTNPWADAFRMIGRSFESRLNRTFLFAEIAMQWRGSGSCEPMRGN